MSSARINTMFGLLPFKDSFALGLHDAKKMKLESNKMIFRGRCFFKEIKVRWHKCKSLLNYNKILLVKPLAGIADGEFSIA